MEIKGMYLIEYDRWATKARALFTEWTDAQAFARLTDGNINFIKWNVTTNLPKPGDE